MYDLNCLPRISKGPREVGASIRPPASDTHAELARCAMRYARLREAMSEALVIIDEQAPRLVAGGRVMMMAALRAALEVAR